jgi:hypothetical protein
MNTRGIAGSTTGPGCFGLPRLSTCVAGAVSASRIAQAWAGGCGRCSSIAWMACRQAARCARSCGVSASSNSSQLTLTRLEASTARRRCSSVRFFGGVSTAFRYLASRKARLRSVSSFW